MLSSPVVPDFLRLSRWDAGPVGGLTSALGPLGTGASSSKSSLLRLLDRAERDVDDIREWMDLLEPEGFSTRSRLSRSRALRSLSAA